MADHKSIHDLVFDAMNKAKEAGLLPADTKARKARDDDELDDIILDITVGDDALNERMATTDLSEDHFLDEVGDCVDEWIAQLPE